MSGQFELWNWWIGQELPPIAGTAAELCKMYLEGRS